MKYREFIGFVLAGGAATVLNYSIFLILLSLSVQYLVSSTIGFVSGIFVSFLINKYFVFRESTASKSRALKYFLAYVGALVFQLTVLGLLVTSGLSPEIANALAIAVTVILNFFVIRKFVFKS